MVAGFVSQLELSSWKKRLKQKDNVATVALRVNSPAEEIDKKVTFQPESIRTKYFLYSVAYHERNRLGM